MRHSSLIAKSIGTECVRMDEEAMVGMDDHSHMTLKLSD